MGNPERILRQFSRQNSTGFYICLRVQIGERQKFCHQYCRNFDCSKTTGRIERTACGLAWTAGNDRAGMAAFGWWRLRLWATIYRRFFMRRLRDFMRKMFRRRIFVFVRVVAFLILIVSCNFFVCELLVDLKLMPNGDLTITLNG